MNIPDKIELVAIGDLVPYAQNARTHSDEQIKMIAASMVEFGWSNPVIINGSGGIIAGHGRVLAAKLNGMEQVPCVRLAHLSAEKERALIIADNKLALNAGWDEEILLAEINDLIAQGVDVALTGFGQQDIDDLIASVRASADRPDPDENIPDPPAVPVSQLGNVWLLGDHRIICGDSTSAEAVKALLGDAKPHLMVTDPPYGVEYEADWRNGALGGKPGGRATGVVENDGNADLTDAWKLFPGDVAYVWHAGNMAHIVAESLIGAGLLIRAQIIWAKNQLVIGRGDYHPKHEPCWYAVRKGKKGHWAGDRKQTTVWEIDKPRRSETGHSTQKPVECMQRPIENNSKPGDAIYEPFSGSGTTIIAGEMTGRRVFAVELNPQYVDIAVRRWQEFTGLAATLEGDGRTFEEVRSARA